MGLFIQQVVRAFLSRQQAKRSLRQRSTRAFRHSGAAQRPLTHSTEPLERRVLLSGETVTSTLGGTPLPATKQLQVTFQATIDAATPKGINQIYNTGTVSGSNFAAIATDDSSVSGTTDPTVRALDRAPQVRAVFVRSSAWSGGFLSGLQTAGLGNAAFGYAVPAGANQLSSVPWSGIDRISVQFDKNVNVAGDDLQLFGATGGTFGINGTVAYDAATFTATWSLASGSIANDKLRLVVASGAAGVTAQGAGGQQLDGEWADTTATAFNSGNGTAGGDFSFALNVAAGDVNGDGVVNTTDGVIIRAGLSPAAYQPKLDINADGAVNTTDFVLYRPMIGQALPAGSPGGTPGSGWVAANANNPPAPSGVAGTGSTLTAPMSVTLQTDVNGDGNADLGDTLQYTVIITNNTAGNLDGVSFASTLPSYLSLVAGSVSATPVLSDSVDTAALAYTENGPAAAVLPNLFVGDGDGTIASATISIVGWVNGQDSLTFGTASGITPTYNAATGQLTFAGSATPAVYQTLLRSVAYSNSSESPNTAARTFSLSVSDGTSSSNSITRGIAVTSVNDAPVLGGTDTAALAYTENDAATLVVPNLTVTDADSTNIGGATISVTGWVNGQDSLTFGTLAGVTPSYNSATGALTFTGAATLAQYQTLLRTVAYSNTSENPSTAVRTINFAVNDSPESAGSNTFSRTVNVTAVNDAPVLGGTDTAALAYTENAAATAIVPNLTVADVDTTIASATVSVSGWVNGQDALAFTSQGGITGNYNATAGTISFSGAATPAIYQTLLRSITYVNSSNDPSTAARTFSVQVNDGQAANNTSNTFQRTINVTAVNDAPTAVAGSGYGAAANIQITFPATAGKGLLVSSTDVEAGTTLSIDTTPINLVGCTVTINADGSFIFNPNAGFTGNATFQYRVMDNGNPAPGLFSAYTTVTVPVSGPVVFFVDDNAAAGGTGTLASPFNTLAAAVTAASTSGNRIFLYSGNYTGGVTLANGVLLYGQGVSGASADAVLGIAPPTGSLARPAIGGTDPVITTTAASTNGINLAAGGTNTIAGLTIGDTTAADIASGANFGTLTVLETTLSGTGRPLNLTSGLLAATFDSITSTSSSAGAAIALSAVGGTLGVTGTTAISGAGAGGLSIGGAVNVTFPTLNLSSITGAGLTLLNHSGTFSATAGTFTTISADDVTLSGSTGSATLGVSITNTAGRSVNVSSKTGGTVNFNGAISDTGTGILLSSNTGATMNFTGGLSLNTGANTAFSATGGGTIAATQNNTSIVNTITTGSGTALNLDGVTISTSHVTFRSISSGAGGNAGIIIDNTSGTGNIAVTGLDGADAGTAPDPGSGGTIANKTGGNIAGNTTPLSISGTGGVGVFLRNTRNVSLAGMQLNDFSNYAILGVTISGFTFADSVINGVNGDDTNAAEGVAVFENLTGSATFARSTIQGGIRDNMRLINTGGSLNRLTFDAVTFGPMDDGNTNGNDSLLIQGQNNAVINVIIQNSTFTSARGDMIQLDLQSTASSDLVIKGSTFHNVHSNVVTGGGGITISGGGSATAAPTLTYDIGGATAAEGNSFRGARGSGLLIIFQTGAGQTTGKIRNNVFGFVPSPATDLDANSSAREAAAIEIRTEGRAGHTFLIDTNQIRRYGQNAIYVEFDGINTAGSTGTIGQLHGTITNNTIELPRTTAGNKVGVHVNFGATTGDNYVGALDIQNNTAHASGSTDTSAGSDYVLRQRMVTTLGLKDYAGGSTDIAAVAAYMQARNFGAESVFVATPSGGGGYVNSSPTVPALAAAAGGVTAAKPTAAKPLTQTQLNSIKSAAIQRWQKAGITSAQLTALKAVAFSIANLGGQTLGLANGGNKVVIDDDAAGYGWYVDTNPADDKEFAVRKSATRLWAKPTAAPAGRMDLLTAVMHEMGHILGIGHTDSRESLMFDVLVSGERRLPKRI